MLQWFQDWISHMTASTIGTSLATTGIALEHISTIIIMIGVLLWMFRYTKVFRWGCIAYLVGLFIEIVGLVIRP